MIGKKKRSGKEPSNLLRPLSGFIVNCPVIGPKSRFLESNFCGPEPLWQQIIERHHSLLVTSFNARHDYLVSYILSKNTHSLRKSVIHVLIGPRQVGKTTIARQIQESVDYRTIYATADSPIPLDDSWIHTHWRRALAEQHTENLTLKI